MSKFVGYNPIYAKRTTGDDRWSDTSQQLQDLRDAADGYGVLAVREEISTYIISEGDEVILCDGTFTVTLPPADESVGKVFRIKNIGTGYITVDGDGDDKIDGDYTAVIECQYESITILSDGSEWYVV